MDATGNAIAVWRNGSTGQIQASRYDIETNQWQINPENISPSSQTSITPQIAMDTDGNAIAVWQNSSTGKIQTNRYNIEANQWQITPEDISPNSQTSITPQIAIDINGNAIAVWQNSTIQQIQVNRYNIQTNQWQVTPENISQAIGIGSSTPQISIDGTGNAISIWQNNITVIIQANRYNIETNQWQINPEDISFTIANKPQLAMDTIGNAIAVWRNLNTAKIQASKYDFETNQWQTTPEDISSTNTNDPQLAMDTIGNAIAVWQRDISGTSIKIQTNKFEVEEEEKKETTFAWQKINNLSTNGKNTFDPQAAIGCQESTGNAVAVWRISDGKNYIIQTSRYNANTETWPTSEDISASGQIAYDPHVAVNETGSAIFIWRRYNGSHYVVKTRKYNAITETWSSVINLSTTSKNAFDPQIVIAPSGNAVAVWRITDGRNFTVQTRRYDIETDTWLAVENISVPGQITYDPQVTMDNLGQTIAIWRRYNGSHYIVQARQSKAFAT